jgi:hypothetical protein
LVSALFVHVVTQHDFFLVLQANGHVLRIRRSLLVLEQQKPPLLAHLIVHDGPAPDDEYRPRVNLEPVVRLENAMAPGAVPRFSERSPMAFAAALITVVRNVTIWWTVDLALVWLVALDRPWLRLERGALQIILAVAFIAAAITHGNRMISALGCLMLFAILTSIVLRLVVRVFDSNSLSAKLYLLAFKGVNALVPWHILPTWLALLNLGAFRETLRARNLCNTWEIPVTNPQNVTADPKYDPAFLMKRHDDGYYDDLSKPSMGAASTNTATVAPEGTGAEATNDSMYFRNCGTSMDRPTDVTTSRCST